MPHKQLPFAVYCCLLLAAISFTQRGEAASSLKFSRSEQPFAYDSSLPLKVKVLDSGVFESECWIKFTYGGDGGLPVPAILVLPRGAGSLTPAPCLLIIHGLGGRKEMMVPLARIAAQDGYASLLIDLPHSGDRAQPIPTFSDPAGMAGYIRATFSQGVIDLRRGIDLLQSRKDINSSKLGLVGLSLGGFMGADLAGVDSRVKVVVLIATGGGIGNILRYQAAHSVSAGAYETTNAKSQDNSDMMQRALTDIDPLTYIGAISPRPLLMENGELDTVVPPEAARQLFAAAGEPKSIDWFPGEGHIPNPLGLYAALTIFLHQNLPVRVASHFKR